MFAIVHPAAYADTEAPVPVIFENETWHFSGVDEDAEGGAQTLLRHPTTGKTRWVPMKEEWWNL